MTIHEIFERQRAFIRQTYPIYEQEVKLQRIDNLEAEMDALRNRVQQVIDAERDGDGWCCYAAFQTTIDRIKAALWGENPQVCEWTEYDSEYPGTYKTSCGDLFSFTEGGIAENDARYCMHCGRMIKPTEKP